VTLRTARVSRAEVGRLSGAWKGGSLPLRASETEVLTSAKLPAAPTVRPAQTAGVA
jgi:hypothetical protein